MRPKGWEDTKFYACMDLTKGGGDYADIYDVFEAGADAILDAIWKMAKESPAGTFTFDTHEVNCFSVPEEGDND